MPYVLLSSRHGRAAPVTFPASSIPVIGGGLMPVSASSNWILAQKGSLVLVPSGLPAVSLAASTVGIQTILLPDRPASSTATGFSPPTLWFSTIAPYARIPGTALATTLARSAVGTYHD